jgi:hypothetical protein
VGDVWDDDYDLDGTPIVEDSVPFRPPRGKARDLKGNTKTPDAPQARQAAIREATGRGMVPPVADWREQLAAGETGKAASSLTDGGLTHNAGSGFGLAGKQWWDT